MRIAQMTFWRPVGRIVLYSGKYQGSRGPRKSMIFMDRFWETVAPAGPDGHGSRA
jgi:dCTP deaminase